MDLALAVLVGPLWAWVLGNNFRHHQGHHLLGLALLLLLAAVAVVVVPFHFLLFRKVRCVVFHPSCLLLWVSQLAVPVPYGFVLTRLPFGLFGKLRARLSLFLLPYRLPILCHPLLFVG